MSRQSVQIYSFRVLICGHDVVRTEIYVFIFLSAVIQFNRPGRMKPSLLLFGTASSPAARPSGYLKMDLIYANFVVTCVEGVTRCVRLSPLFLQNTHHCLNAVAARRESHKAIKPARNCVAFFVSLVPCSVTRTLCAA